MSERKSESYLLEKLWQTLLDGTVELSKDAGKESSNYYIDKLIKTLEDYGGLRGISTGAPLPDPIPAPVRIGTESNHTEFEADGTMQAVGDATTYRDELQSLVGQRLFSAAGRIDYNYAEGAVTFQNNADTTDYVTMNVQLNHDWNLGSAIEPHLHWWQISANVPNWLLQYRWQIQGDDIS